MRNEFNEDIILVPPSENKQFNLSMLGISYENPHYAITRHKAPVSVIEYVISGTGYIEINNKLYTASSGDMYIIPPNSNHKYYSDTSDPWKKIWFNSEGVLVEELMRIYGIENKILFKNANGYHFMKKIMNIAENKTLSGYEINLKASVILFELIYFLSENESKNKTPLASEAVNLKSYIDMNIDKNISIDELAHLIFRSTSQTVRIFKNAYMQTPYDYLLSKKIERANLFLKNTNMPIKEIATRLSFCDEHYFSNLYKKRMGISPSEYRKKL